MKRLISGLSMVEVLIALAVMATAILAIIGLFPTVFKTDRRTMFSSIALYDCQSQLDLLLRNNAFISLTPVTDTPTNLPNGFRSWVGSADPLGDSTLQVVTVTVTWVENGRLRNVTLASEVAP